MDSRATILRGDTRTVPLPDASVDLVVTSPPYWALRSYQDGGEHYNGQIGAEPTPAAYVDALIDCTREWMRVLKPVGSLWVNLGDKYSLARRAYRQRCVDPTPGPAEPPEAGPRRSVHRDIRYSGEITDRPAVAIRDPLR